MKKSSDETEALKKYWERVRLQWEASDHKKDFGYITYSKNLLAVLNGVKTSLEIGFGDGRWIKFPQIGKLIIKNDVEIGSNTCIDRGALSDTIIGPGTKINNLCHIAHNVKIGSNVIIAALVNISGSSIIEDNVWIAPSAALRGHQRIGEGAIIGTGAIVTKNVPPGETWIGNPARKLIKY